MNIETIGFINLYEKFSKSQLNNNIITSSRMMLKRLGFSFYIDKDGKYMVKLPSKALNQKLKLIYRVMNEIKSKKIQINRIIRVIFFSIVDISTKILKELYEISKSSSGRELLILIVI